MNCSKCGHDLGDYRTRRALFCSLGQGDEYTDSWWFCPDCGVYTVDVVRDSFATDEAEHIHVRGPISKVDGDAELREIAKCPDPTDKFCDCPLHRARS